MHKIEQEDSQVRKETNVYLANVQSAKSDKANRERREAKNLPARKKDEAKFVRQRKPMEDDA